MTARNKGGDDHAAANRYLRDEARFDETHDPEALARQVPKVMKQVRHGPAEGRSPTARGQRASND